MAQKRGADVDDRVKYYSSNDLLFGHNLSKIETMEVPELKDISINDAIEFLQIKKYFDQGTRCKTWTDAEFDAYTKKGQELFGLCMHFFNQISNSDIVEKYNSIAPDYGYKADFWDLFDTCKLYQRISNEVFSVLVMQDKVPLYAVLRHKNIVRTYGSILRDYILNHDSITILLHAYEQDFTNSEKLYLPVELSGEDICKYIEHYIDGEAPNANHLSEIINMHPSKQFPISDEIRLKASKRYDIEREKALETGIRVSQGIKIAFDPNQAEVKAFSSEGDEFQISYSTSWLMETLDNPSILNNFIYVFEFADTPQMRCLHVNKISQSSVFERSFASKSSRIYPCNWAFKTNQLIWLMQMHAYYEFLSKQDICLENVIEWFFTEYLQLEFNCPEIRLAMPTHNGTYAEKCSSLAIVFEAALKQYALYVRNGTIDFDLLAMSTVPIRFEDIKSLVPDKYIYGTGKDYECLSNWLFSDQCLLAYVRRIHDEGKHHDCFFDLLQNESIFLSDYNEKDHQLLNFMASFDLISIADDGAITLKDQVKVAILRDLFKNEVINQKHYPASAAYAINEFRDKGILTTEATLFSRPEIDYLNYLLNRSEFSNGLEIRNRYIHGIQHVNPNNDEHRQNYFLLLGLFVLLAIKINDDVSLKEAELKTQENT